MLQFVGQISKVLQSEMSFADFNSGINFTVVKYPRLSVYNFFSNHPNNFKLS